MKNKTLFVSVAVLLLTFTLANVASAATPKLGSKEYREMKAKEEASKPVSRFFSFFNKKDKTSVLKKPKSIIARSASSTRVLPVSVSKKILKNPVPVETPAQ